MNSSNEIKARLLGEPYGTACNKLRKMILFKFAKKLKLDFCFRCRNKIENIDDLSIEHKTSWQLSKNPKETFYNLDNIVFSHLKCNIASSNKTGSRLGESGELHYRSKFTNEEVLNIRNELEKGCSITFLAKKYNVDKKCISFIRDRRNWKHI